MAAPFPTLHGGYGTTYPTVRQISFATSVTTFKNGSEQRFQRQAGRASFGLQFSGLSLTDRVAIETWFNNSLGSAGSFTLYFEANPGRPLNQSAPYPNLVLTDNRIDISEDFLGQFSVSLTCAGTVTQWPGTLQTPVSFPVFANGLTAQYPFMRSNRGLTFISRLPAGSVYTFPQFGAGINGFPSRPLLQWSWSAVLTNADLQTLEAFFIFCCGSYGEFSFVDPYDGGHYTRCRFDMDTLAVKHLGVNQSSVSIAIAELF